MSKIQWISSVNLIKEGSVMEKITQEVFFRRDDLNIFESPYGMKLNMQGCSLSNEVGAPELPVAKIKIAVPSKMRAESLKVKVLKKSNITHQKTFVANGLPFLVTSG